MIVFALDIIYAYKQDIIIYFFSGDNFAVNAYACIAYRSLFHFTSRNPTTVNSVDQSCSLPYVIVYIGIAIMDKLNRYVSMSFIINRLVCKCDLLFTYVRHCARAYNLYFVLCNRSVVKIDIYYAVAVAFRYTECGISTVACRTDPRTGNNICAAFYTVKCVITAIGIKIGYF